MATMATLSDRLKGIIGDRTADALAAVFGMSTVEDLLRHYPRRYVVRGEFSDISSLIEGDEVTVLAEIAAVKTRRANGRNILEVNVTDGSAVMSLTFFNQPWREKEL
jgi:ATP-dependent DNA helicase RecG